MAVSYGCVDIAQYLYSRGARLNDEDNERLFKEVASEGQLEMVKYLHEQGVDIDRYYPDEGYILEWVANNNHLDVARYLIESNVDIGNAADAVMMAAEGGHSDMVELLIEHGANNSYSDDEISD